MAPWQKLLAKVASILDPIYPCPVLIAFFDIHIPYVAEFPLIEYHASLAGSTINVGALLIANGMNVYTKKYVCMKVVSEKYTAAK